MSKKLSHYLLSLLALGAASCTSQQEIEDMSETTEERPDVGTLSDDVTTRVDWYDVLRDRWRKDNEKMSFQLHFRRDILLTRALQASRIMPFMVVVRLPQSRFQTASKRSVTTRSQVAVHLLRLIFQTVLIICWTEPSLTAARSPLSHYQRISERYVIFYSKIAARSTPS